MPEPAAPSAPAHLRLALHDANDELSIAVMSLELLAEGGDGSTQDAAAVQDALEACRKAASRLRTAWELLDQTDADPTRSVD